MNFLDNFFLDSADGAQEPSAHQKPSEQNEKQKNKNIENQNPWPPSMSNNLPLPDNLPLENEFTELLDSASLPSPYGILQPSPIDMDNITDFELPPTPGFITPTQPPSPPHFGSTENLKPTPQDDPSRAWYTVQYDDQHITGDIEVKSKTRLDTPSPYIPDRLYASLKYEIHQTATGVNSALPFVLSKAQVCDAETGEVVERVKDVPALKGTIEAALTRPTSEENTSSNTNLSGNLKVQFGNKLSYHSTKKTYFLRISYFQPDNMSQPLLVKQSAPFKVFARKPNIDPKNRPKSKGTKRKRNHTEDNTPNKRQRTTDGSSDSSSGLSDFKSRLDDLVHVNQQLSTEEKQHAMHMVINKFLSLDPSLACNLPGYLGSS